MVMDAWKNFETSGKITDYLNYKQSVQNEERMTHSKSEGMAKAESRGIGSYGTEHSSDRDDFKCNADG